MTKKKYICTGAGPKCTEPCTIILFGDEDVTNDPAKVMSCGTWLEVPAEEDTNKEQLHRLTTEVFSLPECPEWAKYAAVDACGLAYWYEDKPEPLSVVWQSNEKTRRISQSYDASDWEHSLVERPVKEQFPKLTPDVFSTEECPLWAHYAAVDANGLAYWYDEEPELNTCTWGNTGMYFTQIVRGDKGLRYDSSDWKNSCVERPVKEQLPQLTTEVFSLPECPEWARYAAVDLDGAAYWYDVAPNRSICTWGGAGTYFTPIMHGNKELRYDATDWEHSLIERPVKKQLPKLTTDVFDMEECPTWARYAAVDAAGTAYWYDVKPNLATLPYYTCGNASMHPARQIIHKHTVLRYDATDWKNSLIERPGAMQFPKLTAEVFALPQCPEWAKYAAVDEDGVAWYYERKPRVGDGRWDATALNVHAIYDHGRYARFDATDWKNSLIERQAVKQLPKLTHEVFDMLGCPSWARYAAVDADGQAYYYRAKPISGNRGWNTLNTLQCIYGTLFDASDWEHSLIARPAVAPKLTAEVFSLPQCPAWAKYAAVDEDGIVCYYKREPYILCSRWESATHSDMQALYDAQHLEYIRYDASDWKNSLIERPAAVPDWFKPGVLAYNSDIHTCFHVTDSTEYLENYLEVKVRSFNDDELERKLGQFVLGPNNSRLLVIGFCPDGVISGKPEICVLGGLWLNAEELLTYCDSRLQGIQQYRSKEGTWIDCGLSS